MKEPDDDSDVRSLERGAPIDWMMPYDRFQWTNAVRDHVFQLFAEPWVNLSESPDRRHRRLAKRMHLHNDLLHRLFCLVGFPREIWMHVHAPSPPWRSPEPPLLGTGDLGEPPDVYAPWPPLEWDSPRERELWSFCLDGLCEHLAALALHVLGDRDHDLRLRIEWTLTRLRSTLMSARPIVLGATPVPDEEEVPPLAFWVAWPRMREHLER